MKNANKLISKVIAILFFTLMLTGYVANGQNFEKDYVDGQIFVKFHDDYDPQISVAPDYTVKKEDAGYFADIFNKHELISINRPLDANNDIKLLRTFLLTFTDHKALNKIISDLEAKPEIDYAEKVPCYYPDFKPNDSLYNLVNGPYKWKWHLDVINAEQAWEITKGDPEIKIAIVDNAVWSHHPDLTNKVVLQRNVVNNTPDSNPPNTGDPGDWSHGTHCAGLAAGETNNHLGIAAIGYNTSLIGVRASSQAVAITHSQQGVNWAINNGADVISMSYGGSGYSQTYQNIINTGAAMGISFLASAGNESDNAIRYPAGYAHVIAVVSTNDNDVKTDFSNWGTYVSVCAPGGYASPGPMGLLSTVFENTSMGYYDSYFGTSMATPVAAGLAGLMKSINPNLTNADLKSVMEATCVNIDALNPQWAGQLGAGRIDAYAAVKAVPFSPQLDFSTPVTIIQPGQSINFTDLTKGIPNSWNWTFNGGVPATSTVKDPTGITYSTPGTYNVTLTAQNAYGNETLTKQGFIVVTNNPAPYPQFEASLTAGCIFDPITIEDNTLYNPTSWQWSFTPSTYMFINGTTSASQHPEIIFTAPGVYSVHVTVVNANGSSTKVFEDHFTIDGRNLPLEDDFETGESDNFILSSNSKAFVKVDRRSAKESEFGLHFTGAGLFTGWSGTPTGTTPEQAWNSNVDFHGFAEICNVDATNMPEVFLAFDLRQTYSLGTKFSWFRVLINDTVQIADIDGVMDFNPTTNADPFSKKIFDLSEFKGTAFTITLQSSCRIHDKINNEGDNVFIDNIFIGSMSLPLLGDSNCDGVVNVLDIVTTTNYILLQNPTPFCFENADVNGDNIINVLDVVGTNSIIIGERKHGSQTVNSETGYIYLNNDGIELTNDGTLAGLQFDIQGLTMKDVEIALRGYEFRCAEIGNSLRCIIFSFDNSPLPAERTTIMKFKTRLNDLTWGDVVAANVNAIEVPMIKYQYNENLLTKIYEPAVYPNPFSGSTMISYSLPVDSQVNIALFNSQGKMILSLKDTFEPAGDYQLPVESEDMLPGIYFCRISIGNELFIKKIVSMK